MSKRAFAPLVYVLVCVAGLVVFARPASGQT
jgi:hypothetical protein